ncbi:MAG: hypothetical protein ABGX60_00015 [Candidatus Thioglobus sp.]|jgi:hypothetical protein
MGKTFKKVATVAAVAYGGYALYGAMTAAPALASTGSLLPAVAGGAPAFGSVAAMQAIGSPAIGAASTGFLGISSGVWSGVSTGMSMLGSARAGQAQQVQYEMQAQQEADKAADQELQRKQLLLATIATQRASRGSQGITMAGSPAGMIQSNINTFGYDQALAGSNTASAQSQYLTSGKYAAKSGYTSAANTLLKYGSRTAARGSA